MEIVSGGFVEDALGEGRGGFGRGGPDGPEEDVELRRMCGSEEPFGFCEMLVEFESCSVAGFEAFCEGSAGRVGQQLLGGPERDGRGSGARTFQRNFAEVEIL